ncbi:unnamed protein product [Prorocentrum cordatum]|uniref:K Homology domain-containing protein n=1 Tax=Prorocentrum cordatum TaxID=2364126 RepID=A0ABN9UCT8_9DINO|nr:unnamed protein product [Polarella glacialis]
MERHRREAQLGYKTQNRHVVGPQLARALAARTRRLAQACPDIDKVDEVAESGKLTGWNRAFDILFSRLDLSNVNEMVPSAEKFFSKLQRGPRAGHSSQLKAVGGSVAEVIAGPLKTRWHLRGSRLAPVARAATAGGDHDFDKAHKALCTRCPMEALKELDRVREKKGRRAAFYGEAGENGYDGHDGDDRSELADIADQLASLAGEDDALMLGDAELPDDPEDGIYAKFKQMGRNFEVARDLIRTLKVARDYFPPANPAFSFASHSAELDLKDARKSWAILDCGAARSHIGAAIAKLLVRNMKEKLDTEFGLAETTRFFTFRDGQRKSSMGFTVGNICLGSGQERIEISVMDDDALVLIGADILGPGHASALIDCGNGYLMLPKISNHIHQCRKMPSGHLAINVTTPTWWPNIPLSPPGFREIASRRALGGAPGPFAAAGSAEPTADETTSEPPTGYSGHFYTVMDSRGHDICEFETVTIFTGILGDIVGIAEARAVQNEFASAPPQDAVPNIAGANPAATLVQAAKSRARGFQRCGCRGQLGRKRNGCSRTGGETHPCHVRVAGKPMLDFAQNFRPPKKQLAQAGEAKPQMPRTPRPASPDVSLHCRPEVIYMRWRRMLIKIMKKLANDPSSESLVVGRLCDARGSLRARPRGAMNSHDLDTFQQAIDQYDLDTTHDNHEHGEIKGGKVVSSTACYPETICKAWAKRIPRAGGGAVAGSATPLAADQDETELIYDSTGEDEDQEIVDPPGSDDGFEENDFKELAKILKNSRAGLQVLKMAKSFKRHACNSPVLPKAVWAAAGIEAPEVFKVMGSNGCRRAELTKSWCSSRGVEMFIAPGEAHWLMGKVERRIQLFKRTLTKFRKQNHDCDIDEAISQVVDTINDLDTDENMTIYNAVLKSELEDSQGRRRLTTPLLDCFVARKDNSEFHWKSLSPTEKVGFRRAMTQKANNWKQYQGLRPVPMSEVKGPADAMARYIPLTVAAANSWSIAKGDVASAFLQAYDLQEDLRGGGRGSPFHTRSAAGRSTPIAKLSCGVGEAPWKWRRTVKTDFAKLGLQACDLEPCLWCLRCSKSNALLGLVMCRVDNFILCGGRGHPAWRATMKSIAEPCAWGTWEDMDEGANSIEHGGIQEASDAEGERMMVRLVLYEVLVGTFNLHDRRDTLRQVLATLVTDCKALFYGGAVKSESAGLGLDKRRTAMEAVALRQALEEGGAIVRWVRCRAQLADGMTKASLQVVRVLHAFLKKHRWKIVHGDCLLSARKRSALGKGIFDETTDQDHAEAKRILDSRTEADTADFRLGSFQLSSAHPGALGNLAAGAPPATLAAPPTAPAAMRGNPAEKGDWRGHGVMRIRDDPADLPEDQHAQSYSTSAVPQLQGALGGHAGGGWDAKPKDPWAEAWGQAQSSWAEPQPAWKRPRTGPEGAKAAAPAAAFKTPAAQESAGAPLKIGLLVPQEEAGKVVGKGGQVFQLLRAMKCDLTMQQIPDADNNRRADLRGQSPDCLERGLELITGRLLSRQPLASLSLMVPSTCAETLESDGGQKLQQIRAATGVNVSLEWDASADVSERKVAMDGDPTKMGRALRLLLSP